MDCCKECFLICKLLNCYFVYLVCRVCFDFGFFIDGINSCYRFNWIFNVVKWMIGYFDIFRIYICIGVIVYLISFIFYLNFKCFICKYDVLKVIMKMSFL